MRLFHPSESSLRRFVLAAAGSAFVLGKGLGLLQLTTEDIKNVLEFLTFAIVTGNLKAAAVSYAQRPATVVTNTVTTSPSPAPETP